MNGFERLTNAEVSSLSAAGAVNIGPDQRALLNKILALWLTGEDELKRQKRLDALAEEILAYTEPLEELLSKNRLDSLELQSRIRRFTDPQHFDAIEALEDHSQILNATLPKVVSAPTGRGGPKHDWLMPYLSAVLAAHFRLSSDKVLPSDGDEDLISGQPAYKFVAGFIAIVRGRFASNDTQLPESTKMFMGLAGKRGATLTQFLRKCLNEFRDFPYAYDERTLLLLPEGIQSEFRDILVRAPEVELANRVSSSDEWADLAKDVYNKRR